MTDASYSPVLGQFTLGKSVLGGVSTASPPSATTVPYVGTFTGSTTAIAGTQTTFTPSTLTVFQFQATFDGALYNVTTTWNVSRQGWFFNVYDQGNVLIVASALVGSSLPPQKGINLVGGYFTTSTMFYYPTYSLFAVAP